MSVEVTSINATGFPAVGESALRRIICRLVNALRPEKIILFGSYAYGIPSPDSDVDLLVIMETSAPHVERYLTVSRLLRPRPFPVDILVKTPQEIRQALDQGDFFVREIMTHGLTLYEQDHWE
jgi:predicted nucleotidyltransferase